MLSASSEEVNCVIALEVFFFMVVGGGGEWGWGCVWGCGAGCQPDGGGWWRGVGVGGGQVQFPKGIFQVSDGVLTERICAYYTYILYIT